MSNLIKYEGRFSKNSAFVLEHLEKPDIHLCAWSFKKNCSAEEVDWVQLGEGKKERMRKKNHSSS